MKEVKKEMAKSKKKNKKEIMGTKEIKDAIDKKGIILCCMKCTSQRL